MNFRYLVWDFDGTLFDTYPELNRSIHLAAADLGVAVPRDRIARLLTRTLSMCIQTLSMDYGLDPVELSERIEHYRQQTRIEDKPPIPGAIQICERFQAAGGRNFMFTHRGRESLVEIIEFYGVGDLFADYLTTGDGFPRKPNPGGFLGLIEKNDLAPEDGLAIGDRDLDIVAAKKAGLAACLYKAEPGQGVHPDYLIDSFEALGPILGID